LVPVKAGGFFPEKRFAFCRNSIIERPGSSEPGLSGFLHSKNAGQLL